MAPSAIPDRWIPYKACGMVIEGTRIVCFKVPLRRNVQQGNEEIESIWDIAALLEKLPTLGAVIDLTNTKRYYDSRELQQAGVLYKKIMMPGRMLPPEDAVQEFMDSVDEFLENNRDALLGVHCTHGLNRTGYMVCRYLRDRLRMSPNEAIKKFEKARGYQIERENYISDLLGKTPPPPDVGDNTIIRPHSGTRHNKSENIRIKSPSPYVDDNKCTRNSRSRKRHPNTNSAKPEPEYRKKAKRSDSHSRTYDYKYDY